MDIFLAIHACGILILTYAAMTISLVRLQGSRKAVAVLARACFSEAEPANPPTAWSEGGNLKQRMVCHL